MTTTLLIDTHHKFEIPSNYIRYDYTELPKSFNTGTELMQIILSKSLDGSDRYIVIEGIDRLDAKKSALLVQFIIQKPPSTYILLTATNEADVSSHIVNIIFRVKRMKGARNLKSSSIWDNIKLSMLTRKIPDDDDLFMLFRGIGDTIAISDENLKLACDLDKLLFDAPSKYIASAWAGLHKKERVRITFKPHYKKPEEKKEKKNKIIFPTKIKNKKKKVRKGIGEYL